MATHATDKLEELRLPDLRDRFLAVLGEQMDAAWRARGIKSRTAFLRKALGSYLAELGAPEAARLLERGA